MQVSVCSFVLAFPKLMKTTSCNLERVSLLLLPSVEDFEDRLLATLSDDLMFDVKIDYKLLSMLYQYKRTQS